MPHITYPAKALTTNLGIGWLLPQSVLSSPQSGTRQTLKLGYGRWHGSARITSLADGDVEIRNWLARFAPGDAYTDIPLGVDRVLASAATLRVASVSATGGELTLVGDTVDAPADLIGIGRSDTRRLRVITAVTQAGNNYDVSLWPYEPALTTNTSLKEVTTIPAYQRQEQEGQTSEPIVEFTPHDQSPTDVLWVERVTP